MVLSFSRTGKGCLLVALLVVAPSGCVRLLSAISQRGDAGASRDARGDRMVERWPGLDLRPAREDGRRDLSDGAWRDGSTADRAKPADKAKPADAAGKDLVSDKRPWATDAMKAACSTWSAWTCITGPYGCSVTCSPFKVECVEQYPTVWSCRCYLSGWMTGFPTSTSLTCNSCQKHIPDCWPGLAP